MSYNKSFINSNPRMKLEKFSPPPLELDHSAKKARFKAPDKDAINAETLSFRDKLLES